MDGLRPKTGPMTPTRTSSTLDLIDLHPGAADLRRLVRAGLMQQPKQLPAWLLYDAEGSRLFAEICQQPEYTLTRTEIRLLEQQAETIAAAVGPGVMVEFGIGNARKVDPQRNSPINCANVRCGMWRSRCFSNGVPMKPWRWLVS